MERAQNASEPADSTLRASRTLGSDAAFIDRVRSAAVKAAIDVAAEDAGTANHTQRMNLANRVLMSPGRWAEIMAEGVAANVTIVSKAMADQEIPDGDIEFTVTSLWNAYAGAD